MGELTYRSVFAALPEDGSWVTARTVADTLGRPGIDQVKRWLDNLVSGSTVRASSDRAVTGLPRGTGYRRKDGV